MGTIEIIPLGKDAAGWERSFEETYRPVVDYLVKTSYVRDVVHTVPGGPAMAEKVRQMIDDALKEEAAQGHMPFDMMPIVDVMARLRGPNGCPWDIAQTHRTLRRFLLEEVYEMLDAIDQGDDAGMREELGDVLYQVVIHSRIGEEEGLFSAQDIVRDITEKMIRRHPHVFSEKSLENKGESVLNWDRLKQGEKRQHHDQMLDGVVKGLPSLLQAYKLQEKAAKVGFDWDKDEDVLAKLDEEWQEFQEALQEQDGDHAEEEAGDVLFVFANVCRHFHIEPECALHRANSKFRRRFSHVEQRVKESGRSWNEFSLDELDSFWKEAKDLERRGCGDGE
ncbi:nucleoside triphosphate pyrophosphohydrolase [Megasphaera sp. ASD88]|uniref:Nucleoside triphosphate pyrophosphohydrolase n=1 Tax=Megasphaera stantonii TaxID=2144175 RepID=A0A346AW79_9FIRM|nr:MULTISPECIES: nucleoside triphosphate pyrophosphohydrolase [Megasphaera]AXL20122.1 nucleoside triphosphate pyrophosphohydrolase [Megasphaera stantonii]MBM6731706.1 nucleoside triphosphate pyrophosphohydrolase [Megasphaera stantonii]PAV40062.1 nucleoside triphosphate pyrophosphohydrolase [Megasphaera sp. ASD88]